jgi:hypothetical protein
MLRWPRSSAIPAAIGAIVFRQDVTQRAQCAVVRARPPGRPSCCRCSAGPLELGDAISHGASAPTVQLGGPTRGPSLRNSIMRPHPRSRETVENPRWIAKARLEDPTGRALEIEGFVWADGLEPSAGRRRDKAGISDGKCASKEIERQEAAGLRREPSGVDRNVVPRESPPARCSTRPPREPAGWCRWSRQPGPRSIHSKSSRERSGASGRQLAGLHGANLQRYACERCGSDAIP